jgi:hypothetical protein
VTEHRDAPDTNHVSAIFIAERIEDAKEEHKEKEEFFPDTTIQFATDTKVPIFVQFKRRK